MLIAATWLIARVSVKTSFVRNFFHPRLRSHIYRPGPASPNTVQLSHNGVV